MPEPWKANKNGVNGALTKFWGLPSGSLTISREQQEKLIGLSAREIKAAVLEMLGSIDEKEASWLH